MEGLEKIAADLRVERTKATNALRDRARLKVDNESLHQELKEKEDQVGVLEESLTDLKNSLHLLGMLWRSLRMTMTGRGTRSPSRKRRSWK